MNKTIATFLFLAITVICNAQTSKTKYYAKLYQDEVTQDKAKFSESTIHNVDGSVTTEIKKLKENRILNSETYKGEEPFGTWTYQSSRWTDTLNYNFPLVYSDKKCDSTFKNWLEDNDAIGYKAPKIMLAESLANYIGKTLRYPAKARENNIQGRVNLVFTITEEGKVENISIHQGANILLDKEAFRILRQLKFSTPPILKGRPQSLCQSMSISFRLD